MKKFIAEEAPKILGNLEKLITIYGKNGFSVGSGLTYADLAVFELTHNYIKAEKTILDKFPSIVKVRKSVEANVKVANYLKNRPESNF